MPRVFWKQPFYPTKLRVRTTYILTSENPTCGFTLGMSLNDHDEGENTRLSGVTEVNSAKE